MCSHFFFSTIEIIDPGVGPVRAKQGQLVITVLFPDTKSMVNKF